MITIIKFKFDYGTRRAKARRVCFTGRIEDAGQRFLDYFQEFEVSGTVSNTFRMLRTLDDNVHSELPILAIYSSTFASDIVLDRNGHPNIDLDCMAPV